MKKKINRAKGLPGLLLLLSPMLHAQYSGGLWAGKQANNWYWSFNQGITFESGSPQYVAGGQTTVMEGTAVMSNTAGELLFYASNGTVWNKNHMQMQNGDGILSGSQSSTQSGIIIPKPGSETLYYLFNIAVENGLVYSEIDMSLNNGLGAVTATKNVILTDDARVEKITAVYHADKERIWIISHRSGNNQFIAYLISADGIAAPVTSAVGYSYTTAAPVEGAYVQEGPAGQLKASPDGTKLAAAQREGQLTGASFLNGLIEVFDFDNSTGTVSNPLQITIPNSAYGVEFSPNSRYLYVLDNQYNPQVGQLGATFEKMHQYDLQAANIPASDIIIGQYNSRYMSALQLGPDGKIYMMNSASLNTLVAVSFPNNAGVAAGLQTGVLILTDGDSIGMPTFNQTYFQSGITYEETCGNNMVFDLVRIPGITSTAWNFGDPNSGAANESATGQHIFSAPGTYTVTATITSNGATQTAAVQVEVTGGLALTQPENLVQCVAQGANQAVFDLTVQEAVILTGLNAQEYTVAYYPSELDAQSGTNAINNPEAFTSGGQVIYVGVANTQNGCTGTTAFGLVLSQEAVLPQLPQLSACSPAGQPTAVFNLTMQEPALFEGGNAEDYSVAYFISEEDAQNGTNAIATPQSFTSAGQTVYVVVTAVAGGCTSATQFSLVVSPAPVLPTLPALTLCSPDNNGTAQFNLTKQEQLLGNANLPVSYFTSEEDAAANTNFIVFAGAFENTQNPQTIYVRSGEGDCYAITSFEIVVADGPSPTIAAQMEGCPPFNLTQAIAPGQAGLAFSYYASEEDATEAQNAIPGFEFYSFEGSQAVVYVRAENTAGCFAIQPVTLTVKSCDIPKGISPNGDDLNNDFDLTFLNVSRLVIFNRYGMEVYSLNNYTAEWHGQDSKNHELPTGVYYYMAQPATGGAKTGWVYLNRDSR